ncbi:MULTISPECIES: DUF2333 family protein [Mesorhizobium]|uniref:DUF2333 family protein n=1 Tax=Mesorhizobium denitrificans TaxID=2294114 RepID=A0A371XE06_9HYPH|nr:MULTISPECIES: DUF2333 family protein [Mesorhizobium]RFC67461.1 DUF2333 family protein [Mesorhizobium denitrificans]
MLDPIVAFFVRVFGLIGRGIGFVVGILLWPLLWLTGWYTQRNWAIKGVVALVLVGLAAFYGYFIWQTQIWTNFNPDYPNARVKEDSSKTLAGAAANADASAALSAVQGGSAVQQTAQGNAQSCQRSAIVDITTDLIDFNVNQNAWIPSMLASKLGFFGIPWKNTPFLDNKAAFQTGINQAIRRTTIELVDTLGRVRGTSQIDQGLQSARENMNWGETVWYVGSNGLTRPTPGAYRAALKTLQEFNDRLGQCNATFDARADNLMVFLDRISGDIGSTSDILRAQIQASDAGWLDPRADDRFWFAYGQLYAYYGLLKATHVDFNAVINDRNLRQIWDNMESQLRFALDMQPWIISNGSESSFIFPSHLATLGFNLLRVRSQLVEIRGILDR